MLQFYSKRAKLVTHSMGLFKELIENDASNEAERASCILKYKNEWNELLSSVDTLRQQAIQGNFRASRFRSVLWRILLGLFTPENPKVWVEEAKEARKHYRELRRRVNQYPWSKTQKSPVLQPNDNPLSQEDGSTWNQYFCDKELRLLIEQDVLRTFPGVDFFKNKEFQEAMVDILFCYAREYPRMCYRQVIVHFCSSDTMCEVLNPDYLIEDCYMLFTRIMESTAVAYHTSDIQPTMTGSFPSRTESGTGFSSDNQMMERLTWIEDCLFRSKDEALHRHLTDLKITLPIYGIRWLRLLFGREFPLQDLLVLWDAIFAEGSEFQLVNYIVVAMLLCVKEQLLNSGYTECMNILMRYPPQADIGYVIKKALHLQNPDVYKDPPVTAVQLPRQVRPEDQSPPASPVRRRVAQQPQDKKQSKQVSAIANSLKRLSTKRNKNYSLPVAAHHSEGIVDGFTVQEPAALIIQELRENREIMNLCRIKMLQYKSLLEKKTDPDNIDVQVITGIHELSTLLDVKNASPFVLSLLASTASPPPMPAPKAAAPEVEPAYEVGESSRLSLLSPSAPIAPSLSGEDSDQSSVQAKLPLPNSEVKMTTFSETEGPVLIDNIVFPTSCVFR
ncbi:TBC1 domain family member 5 [Nilaparvata lugens]|uniref:TBC1 domain family member 5 n=1 Tax=Nilaparvata lugens TaxID=108931 RepID=UPI00193D2C42|nr:TBC1 domain family member 5 [Nilaparvata lugens]